MVTYVYGYHNGKTMQMVYANGDYIGYEYDVLDRVEKLCYNGVVRYVVTYAKDGTVSQIDDLSENITYKYEYGHKLQMDNIGVLSYIFDVAIPSLTINSLQRLGKLPYDYYSYPWEKEANTLGGSALSQGWKSPLPQGSDTSLWELVKMFF